MTLPLFPTKYPEYALIISFVLVGVGQGMYSGENLGYKRS